jgi:hypothetical protein
VTPAAAVAALRSRGLTLTVLDGRLRVSPASALTRADQTWLAAHWREVADLITPQPPPPGPTDRSGPGQPVWTVLASTDPAAVGGKWVGNEWFPPAAEPGSGTGFNGH